MIDCAHRAGADDPIGTCKLTGSQVTDGFCTLCQAGNGPHGTPSLFEQAGNLALATGRLVASGGKLAGELEHAERLAICETCEYWTGNRCRKCGCYAVKLKIDSESCPIGKW